MTGRIVEVVMPQLGVNDQEVVIVEWLREPGAVVQPGHVLAMVETTKASVELECEAEGYFFPLFDAGSRVPIRAPVALIAPTPDRAVVDAYLARISPPSPAGEEVKLTAGARRLVEQHGLDLAALPRNRILRERDLAPFLPATLAGDAPLSADASGTRMVIYGASQGGECLAELVRARGGYEVVAFLDDDANRCGRVWAGLPVRRGSDLELLADEGIGAVATHIPGAAMRLALLERAIKAGVAMPNLVHPNAFVAGSAALGRGNLIKAGATLDTAVQVGDCCIIDNGAIIPHHTRIGRGCHIAPGASMGGDCRIGDGVVIGIGATISARIAIGNNVIVGVGAVVARDIPDNAIVEGAPARIVGERRT